jgi:hypothetical protein
MTGLQWLQTILEVGVAAFLIWGLFNEDKFIAFEKKYFGWHKDSAEEEEL